MEPVIRTRLKQKIGERQVYLGVQVASQPHPHLEDGTVYRQVRPTQEDSNQQSACFGAEFFDLNYLLLHRQVCQRSQRVNAKSFSVEEVSEGKRHVLGFRGEA